MTVETDGCEFTSVYLADAFVQSDFTRGGLKKKGTPLGPRTHDLVRVKQP